MQLIGNLHELLLGQRSEERALAGDGQDPFGEAVARETLGLNLAEDPAIALHHIVGAATAKRRHQLGQGLLEFLIGLVGGF